MSEKTEDYMKIPLIIDYARIVFCIVRTET